MGNGSFFAKQVVVRKQLFSGIDIWQCSSYVSDINFNKYRTESHNCFKIYM